MKLYYEKEWIGIILVCILAFYAFAFLDLIFYYLYKKFFFFILNVFFILHLTYSNMQIP